MRKLSNTIFNSNGRFACRTWYREIPVTCFLFHSGIHYSTQKEELVRMILRHFRAPGHSFYRSYVFNALEGLRPLTEPNDCPAYNFSLKKYFIKHKSSRIKEIISKSEQVVNVEPVLLVLGNIWKNIWRIMMDAVKWV